MTLIPRLTFTELQVVSMERLQRIWHASRKRLSSRTPGSVPFWHLLMLELLRPVLSEVAVSFLDFSPWILVLSRIDSYKCCACAERSETYTAVAGNGKVGPVNQVNHTCWVAVVTPTDRPKSVHNGCVIDFFCGVVCVVTFPCWHFCWCSGFCHRTESDIFLFHLYFHYRKPIMYSWKEH